MKRTLWLMMALELVLPGFAWLVYDWRAGVLSYLAIWLFKVFRRLDKEGG